MEQHPPIKNVTTEKLPGFIVTLLEDPVVKIEIVRQDDGKWTVTVWT